MAVDVETNLLNREEKLKAVEKDKIERERLIFAEIKLDMLTNTVNEVMHMISRKEELVVQIPHVPLVPEKTNINVPKKFATHLGHPKIDNDCFMYYIHNTTKDEVQNQKEAGKSSATMYMIDDLAYRVSHLKYDYQEEYYKVKAYYSKQPKLFPWEEQTQLSQCKDENQTLHIEQYCKEENT